MNGATHVATVRTLETERLCMVPVDARGMKAWLAGDGAVLREATGARFREPLDAPPLFRDDLGFFSEKMASRPGRAGLVGVAGLPP